jgi:hypothetical protein
MVAVLSNQTRNVRVSPAGPGQGHLARVLALIADNRPDRHLEFEMTSTLDKNRISRTTVELTSAGWQFRSPCCGLRRMASFNALPHT